MHAIKDWFKQYFNDPQVILLVSLLAGATLVILWMGEILASVLAGLVLAYLLEGPVQFLERLGMPRLAAVLIVCILSSAFSLVLVVGLLPLVSGQLIQLVQQLPTVFETGYAFLESLPERYPKLITEDQVLQLIELIRREIAGFSQGILTWSLASVAGIFNLIIYLVLLPFLVFFFLKDKALILFWSRGFLPQDYSLLQQVWREVDLQIGNYMRGKFWQILIVWALSFAVFALMGLRFATLLGLIVGLGVLIPYIGGALAALPVAFVGYAQWGFAWSWESQFVWLMIVYMIIQLLDGNVLAPVLFSEVVDLHPIAIIVAILVFGGLWGFWGLFFAVPLASVVQAVLKAWPQRTPAAPLKAADDRPPLCADERPASERLRGKFSQP